MQFLIFVGEPDPEQDVLTAPVRPAEADYLRHVIAPRLRVLSNDEYVNGPLAIHVTAAPFSYVLDECLVYWCVEWDPGLLVLRFSPSGEIRWCSLRSPVPDFGGRPCTDEELDAYDEDAENPQYNLVFDAWDPSVDPDDRQSWGKAAPHELSRWESAMQHVRTLGNEVWRLAETDPDAYERWLEKCQTSEAWRGVATS